MFKPGDKLLCIADDHNLVTPGTIVTVELVHPNMSGVSLTNGHGLWACEVVPLSGLSFVLWQKEIENAKPA
jgi:hypothetical protein